MRNARVESAAERMLLWRVFTMRITHGCSTCSRAAPRPLFITHRRRARRPGPDWKRARRFGRDDVFPKGCDQTPACTRWRCGRDSSLVLVGAETRRGDVQSLYDRKVANLWAVIAIDSHVLSEILEFRFLGQRLNSIEYFAIIIRMI